MQRLVFTRGQQPIKLPTRFINIKILIFTETRIYGKYIVSHYTLVLEYTKTRIYCKCTGFFEGEDLRF